MSTQYHVYQSNDAGGPVDYTAVVATAAGLSYASAPIPAGSTVTFAVRAFDTVSGLEESNLDAAVTVTTDAAGLDVTNRPRPPALLTATPLAGARLRVEWQYPYAAPGARAPAGFRVYIGTGGSPSYASPAATVGFVPGQSGYATTLTGLSDGVAYTVGVRAYNATAEEPNAVAVTATAVATGPLPVAALAAVLTNVAG